jgi:hypothetical protein
MKLTRLLFSALPVGAAIAVLSCGEPGPAAPELQVPALQVSSVSSWTSLLKCRPLAYDSVSKTIGWKGGSIRVSKHVLAIPAGALSQSVKITLVAPSDTVNRIEFQPEGLVFQRPASLTMSYANCNASRATRPKHVAYVNDSLAILEVEPSVDDISGSRVTGQLSHFSGYAISW